MSIAVYAGSFDPFTAGHLEIVRRAAKLFDRLYVTVTVNLAKETAFTVEERQCMISEALKSEGILNAEAAAYCGFTVDFARSVNAGVLLRGIRSTMDLEYERQNDAANKYLAPEIETVYLVADGRFSFISSSAVREIASFGGVIDGLVPDAIKNKIAERLIKR